MADVQASWDPAYAGMVERNIGLLKPEEQERLRTARCAVFGTGGLGGVAFEVLVRSGVGHFNIVDKDAFDASNLNRQIHATRKTIGHVKVQAARERALEINPTVEVATWERVDGETVREILRGADVAVQAIDTLRASLVLSRAAREMGVPFVEGWAIPFPNCRTFTAETPSLEEAYGLPTADRAVSDIPDEEIRKLQTNLLFGLGQIEGVGDFYDQATIDRIAAGHLSSFAPMVWGTAVMVATEALKVLLGWGTLALAPRFAVYDPYEHRMPGILPAP